ncbi:GNAT family N-acetyltransferase [Ancylomarina sp. 16SWW S1-10-2]|uniref:GNAT family N-acetyltransferase n=1 Tax=Ancylomarina sp. 16SWW S1-10-2 TaxID=2499681 RepID=UPI0012AE78A1|nr:GNAT family N-acetyltransferase [Ancylomarina sp. 16SWW S1-10-2]MRT94381.1 GNAT family N-acetyltransferase [Ancylomarina sp. 16SWW S1-10-2]
MKFIKTDITDTIKGLRLKLYQKLTAPIDAMWEMLYIGPSQHYLIQNDNITLGYCCISKAGCLIQIFLEDDYLSQMDKVVGKLIKGELIRSACLSSNEPVSFAACLYHSKSINANTFCFEHLNKTIEVNSNLKIELVTSEYIPAIKAFMKEQIGLDDTFGYTENLVSRKEIFMLRESGVIIATSECRISNSQPEIADIGIIVSLDYQGKGIATQLMQIQTNRVIEMGRKPICSTTLNNIASRKAIENSGFYCSNIIFDISFTHD